MEVKIGVQNAARELVIETDESADVVRQQVAEAVTSGSPLTLSDNKGRTVVVPGGALAYIEIGTGVVGHVGFRS